MMKIHAGYAENDLKNQYNILEPKILTINATAKDVKKAKELTITIDDEKTKTTENYKFLNSPDDFEEWVTNRTMGLIFKYINQKG
jgi:hypothetical protein